MRSPTCGWWTPRPRCGWPPTSSSPAQRCFCGRRQLIGERAWSWCRGRISGGAPHLPKEVYGPPSLPHLLTTADVGHLSEDGKTELEGVQIEAGAEPAFPCWR